MLILAYLVCFVPTYYICKYMIGPTNNDDRKHLSIIGGIFSPLVLSLLAIYYLFYYLTFVLDYIEDWFRDV